jgi:hypothetical protein
MMRRVFRALGRTAAACIVVAALAACSGGEDEPLPTYRIGGTVTDLSGTIVLQNNGGDDLSVSANGAFTFVEPVRRGNTYAVTIRTQPQDQVCTVANATGVAAADVTNVLVNCIDSSIPTYTIGGTVSGLVGEVILRNGPEFLTVRANGPFTFATRVRDGTAYSVTIATQPEGQACTVANGTGTVVSGNVTNIVVTCITTAPTTYTIGGTVSGLSGGEVRLRNGNESLRVSANGPFAFGTRVTSGTAYSVTVESSPSGQTCSVANGSGTVGTADVTNVAVTCNATTPDTYTIGGTVSGLSGGDVRLRNGNENLRISTNGVFTFDTRVTSGTAYSVTVEQSPNGQTCSVANGSGTVGTANVTNIAVSCSTTIITTYAIGGTVSGLDGTVVLGLGGEQLEVGASGPFTFATRLASGTSYSVAVTTQPTGQTCTVTNGSGQVPGTDVTNVAVACVDNPPEQFSIGGTVTGLTSGALLQLGLQHPGSSGTSIDVTADGPFSFGADTVAAGDPYTVSVVTQPEGHTCTVTNGSGTAQANVTNVVVDCVAVARFSLGGRVTGLVGAGLRIENGTSNAVNPDPGATSFTLPTELDDGTTYDAGIAAQPQGQTCVITGSQGIIAGGDVADVEVTCVDNVTDELRGTYRVSTLLGETLAYLTFFRDGVYVYGSVEHDPGCGGELNGNGAEYGVYTYDESTGAFTIRNAVVDTNGACGVWNGTSRFAGVLTSSGGGGDRTYLLALAAGGLVELAPVESRSDRIWGSFADVYQKNVWVFVDAGDDVLLYFNTQTQGSTSLGYSAGVEYACGTIVGSGEEGLLTPDLTATCLAPAPGIAGPVDTNGTAGLSHHAGAWSFRVNNDDLTSSTFRGFRVERD